MSFLKTVLLFLTNQAAQFSSCDIAQFIFSCEFHKAIPQMDLSIIFDKTIGGEYNSISLHFCKLQQHVFFYFKAQMLELHKIFLLVKFFNRICCNKSLKAKISCFFLMFFLFIPPPLPPSPLPEAGVRLESERLLHYVTQAGEIQKSASMELHEWSKNMVNVKNHQFFEGKLQGFFSVI